MLFSRQGQAVLVAHERASRFTLITRQPNKAAKPVLKSLVAVFKPLPRSLRRSIAAEDFESGDS